MYKFLLGGAMALALTSTSLSAAPILKQAPAPQAAEPADALLWLAKDNKGKGNGKKLLLKGKGHNGKDKAVEARPGKGNGKPEHAAGPKAKAATTTQAANRNGNSDKNVTDRIKAREDIANRLVSNPAPAGRDMLAILGATTLALATPQLVVADVPEEELITYANCPPGLAKKAVPCVPPGLAKKGVTYEEWASYDAEQYDDLWVERRTTWLDEERDFEPNPELLLLESDQIAMLYDLDPAPEGRRYALIDGLPVLLDEEDYTSLMLVNQLAQVPDLDGTVPIAPTAALTQSDLVTLYRLPQPGADENYAVVNGQLVKLSDSQYDVLQMIRVARAVL